MTTEASEKEAQVSRPKIQETPEFKEALSKATSRYQSQASQATKKAEEAQGRLQEMETRLRDVEQEIEVARLAGDDEEEAKRIRERMALSKKLDEKQRNVDAKEQAVETIARTQAISLLSTRYGIPAEDLEGYGTAAEMEKAAKDLYITRLEQERKEDPDAPPAKGPGFDVGTGRGSAPSSDWVKLAREDPKEFDRRAAAIQREAAARRR